MKEKEISRQEFDDLKSNVKDLKQVFDKINSIALSTEKPAIEMKYMREAQTKMDGRITAIEEKPIKRYDSNESGYKVTISNSKAYYVPVSANTVHFTTSDINYIDGEYIFDVNQI